VPDYINPSPPPTDPDEIAQAAFERIRTSFSNYDPRESQLATVVIIALAFRAAEIADLVPLIPKSIFRWFGANVIGLPPDDGNPAGATVTIFVRDDVGYTIDADTVLSIEDDEGNTHLFSTDVDVEIPEGETSVSNVNVTALEDGPEANGITAGAVSLVEALDYVINVTQQGTSGGGLDAEDDNTYLNRLSRRLGLIPRPVLAEDFAALAMVEFPEIWRMASINHYQPGAFAFDLLNFSGTITGGTWKLTWGSTTANLAWNATPEQVKLAMVAADPTFMKYDEIKITPLSPTQWKFEWLNPATWIAGGSLGGNPPFFMTTDVALTGTGTPNITGAGRPPGMAYDPGDPAQAGVVSVCGILEDGQAFSATFKDAVKAFLEANREWGFVVNVPDPTFHTVDATFTFTTHLNYNKADVEARAEAAVAAYVNPVTFAAPPNDPRGWNLQKTIYHWEIVGVLQSVEGLDRLITLTIGLNGGAQGTTDKVMTGDFPLPQPGNIIGTAA